MSIDKISLHKYLIDYFHNIPEYTSSTINIQYTYKNMNKKDNNL